MSAYRLSAAALLRLSAAGSLGGLIREHLRGTGRGVGDQERHSWERSLPVLAQDLIDAGLGGVEMLVEYQLPLSSKRVDVVLAGVHPRTGADSYVVVELKQWSAASTFENAEPLVRVQGVAGPRLHPGVQVSEYCEYLADFLAVISEAPQSLHGAVYLHNALDRDIADLFARPVTEHSRLFTTQRRGQFLEFLSSNLAPVSGARAADRFLTSAVRPSKLLLEHAAGELNQRHDFTLLDEQRVAYELVLHAVERARAGDRKRVIIVSGGPGSGKSVVALSLLGELAGMGRAALHATGSRSFTQTLRKYAGRRSARIKKMFLYFNSFTDAERNGIDVLICDEAHRIRETSANRFTPRANRHDRPQLDELIAAARVPVFLLDEHQVVKPGELGSVDVVREFSESLGLDVELVPLTGQFRCGGSTSYESWVLALLGLDGPPYAWVGDGRFDVRLADSPEDLEALLAEQQRRGLTARLSAGFCWPWSDPRADGTLEPDVRVGAWARPWNVKSDRKVGDAPGSSYWATDPAGFGQVGCIYTAQGFEYEWSGVIIGPDLVARDGRLITRRDESRDPAFRNRRNVTDEEADRLIRNTYKVLLTRGMRGTAVYATDPETQRFLADMITPRVTVDISWLPRSANEPSPRVAPAQPGTGHDNEETMAGHRNG